MHYGLQISDLSQCHKNECSGILSSFMLNSFNNALDQSLGEKPNVLLILTVYYSLKITGGNCNTAMIAALSAEEKNVSETVLTCRFAQRVARILNKPV